MTRKIPSAQNASEINEALNNSVEHLRLARKELNEAMSLIEAGESEPEIKTPRLRDVTGAISTALAVLSTESMNWAGYYLARKDHRK